MGEAISASDEANIAHEASLAYDEVSLSGCQQLKELEALIISFN